MSLLNNEINNLIIKLKHQEVEEISKIIFY